MRSGGAGGWWAMAALWAAGVGCATGGDAGGGDVVRPDGGDGETAGDDGVDVPYDGACPPGRTRCATGCADLTTDPANCGGCGHACGATEVCNEGSCAGTCGGGRIPCGAECIDPASNREHCGRCDNACEDALNADGACELSTCILTCRTGWQDRDGAPGCEYACTPSGAAEDCNGIDDDCDGATDEGFPCAVGRATPCTTSCGTTGSGACSASCTPPAGAACLPPVESCNGVDEDCDTVPDDGFACAPGTSGSCVTPCGSAGSRACDGTCNWGACTAPGETCNGVDDDCDGDADDGFPCAAGSSGTCSTSCGSIGTHSCDGSCNWSGCAAPIETCNGRDDDCDTAPDDGFECVQGSTTACTASCGGSGTRTCGTGCAWGSCAGPAEACNGLDDDCDTAPDDGFECVMAATGSCTTSCGSTGARSCTGSCNWSTCAATETCNDVDDDCDGATDEGFNVIVDDISYGTLAGFLWACDGVSRTIGPECNAAIHRYCWNTHAGCSTTGFGPVGGTPPGATVTCVTAPGAIDATFPTLATFHAPCDGSTQVAGPDCNAAISRFCASRGYVSGFGPVENSYPSAWVVCVPSSTATYLSTDYTTLSGYDWRCDGTTERWGTGCNAAIHQYCRALGHTSGFGPTENSGDRADVVCLDG
ncbi:MAG: hypothetical protein HY905_05310 [Deltaproteobacteria bacterium]|nr:hypothetical protein [Deltaproteobacteria bacterium]